MVTKVDPMPNIEINGGNIKPDTGAKKRFLRTCSKCGVNCYSSGEYSTHMKEKHGKIMPKDTVESRTVDTSLTKKDFDVPEEILVKPRKVEEKKDTVAKSRKGRQPATKTEKKEPSKRTRRTKAQMKADGGK